ncbi:hypothetical protein PoB_000782100 [Plakobranchus ocellatus]|uniref:Uncharacterized protein n=1 Tax=Plakobranchus ocellatus TaxID=259542 RepID=A0AAV3YDQ8_9GAST|nr:hypothetical protein PoB_000782100 [Plakobranchus ocellatus]
MVLADKHEAILACSPHLLSATLYFTLTGFALRVSIGIIKIGNGGAFSDEEGCLAPRGPTLRKKQNVTPGWHLALPKPAFLQGHNRRLPEKVDEEAVDAGKSRQHPLYIQIPPSRLPGSPSPPRFVRARQNKVATAIRTYKDTALPIQPFPKYHSSE